jgi:hypothetical protein
MEFCETCAFAGPAEKSNVLNIINSFAYKHSKRGNQGFALTFNFILGSASFMRQAAYALRAQFSTPLYVQRS